VGARFKLDQFFGAAIEFIVDFDPPRSREMDDEVFHHRFILAAHLKGAVS
jgi:hypothetical protein